MDSLRDGKSELVNTNKLVRFYKGTTGLKTGTTSIAKYCLSASAERDGLSLVAVVLAGETSADRFEGAKKMLDYGFANYSFSKIESLLKEKEIEVKGGVVPTVKVQADSTVDILLPKSAKKDIKRITKWNKDISAPVKKGDILGYVDVFSGDEQIGRIPITAKEEVKKMTFWVSLSGIIKGLFKL
jgi:D-alanyl-D-alanine carboxypeptidase (penicillin-binding protein 5/6)